MNPLNYGMGQIENALTLQGVNPQNLNQIGQPQQISTTNAQLPIQIVPSNQI